MMGDGGAGDGELDEASGKEGDEGKDRRRRVQVECGQFVTALVELSLPR